MSSIRVSTSLSVPSMDLVTTVATTGWNAALKRWRPCEVQAVAPAIASPKTLTMKLRPPRIKLRSFQFQPGTLCTTLSQAAIPSPLEKRGARPKTLATTGDRATRISPPDDVIKLDDRLYYLLQPPLESLLSGAALKMPFCPFPYQLAGISFLFPRYAAILADEMGLGKTMQAITTIRLLLHAGQIRNVLLICPKPLVTNWQREFQMWAPEVPLMIIEGDQSRRHWQWELDDIPVKISNYEAILRDREVVGDGWKEFDLVVLDEAQRIKNRSSSSHQVVCSIARTRSWALTGTPVENTPDDLVGIFDFIVPGYLSPGMTPRRLRACTRDYIVRRTKDQVLTDLPPKLHRDALVELSGDQRLAYERAEQDGVIHLKNLREAVSIQHVFELVLRLKQICNFDPESGRSSKFDRLEADLEEVAASGKKAIVFSQWVNTLEELRSRLERFGPLEYHGRIPARQRDGVIEQLRSDPRAHVILMSYGAGSVGLNLQFCEYVFLFDRWWNPAVEDQAINRAHRIGAAGPVTVTRFLCHDTIEERIDQVLVQKRELFESILAGTNYPTSSGLSQAEIFGLFDLHIPGGKLKIDSDAA